MELKRFLKNLKGISPDEISILFGVLGAGISLYLWSVQLDGGSVFCDIPCVDQIKADRAFISSVSIAGLSFVFHVVVISVGWVRISNTFADLSERSIELCYRTVLAVAALISLHLKYVEIVVELDVCVLCWILNVILISLVYYEFKGSRKR